MLTLVRLRDEEVLLESCCFLLNYHQEQIKNKRKGTWVREIFKKRIEQGVYMVYFRRCVSMIENRISGYLYDELFSKSNEENCTAFQSMAWSFIVHKNTMKNCSPSIFLLVSPFLSFISFFIKARIFLQLISQAFSILYMFSPFSFVFINALITFTQAKISL